MRLGRTVRDALGHRVRFRPDDVTAEIPTVLLEGEGYAPGDAEKLFL